MSTHRLRHLIVLISALMIALVVYWLLAPAPITTQHTQSIDIRTLPTTGNRHAPLQIVAFEDLKCSNCMRFNETLLPKIKTHYIDTNKASYSVALLAFIPGSPPAANAAYCIHQQHSADFFSFIQSLYAHQPPEDENWATIPYLMQHAHLSTHADLDRLADCLVNQTHAETLARNMTLATRVMGENNVATPTVFVNGTQVTPLTWKQLQAVIHKVSHS